MNKELLIEVGQALYGDQWQSNLARELNINSRNIRHWLKEDTAPDWLGKELKTLLQNQEKKTKELLGALK